MDGRMAGYMDAQVCVRYDTGVIFSGKSVVAVSGTPRRCYRLGLSSAAFTADSDTIVAGPDKPGIINTPTAQTAAHLLIKQLMVLILCDDCVPLIVCACADKMFTACCRVSFPLMMPCIYQDLI